jgi:hypothetical protein
MTLVAVIQNGDDFNIVADTLLTDSRSGKPKPYSEYVVKVSILNPKVCVAFADDEQRADEAFREICGDTSLSTEQLLGILKRYSDPSTHRYGDQAEFLLAVHGSPSQLFFVKDGRICSKRAGHLGSSTAYREFQGYRLNQLKVEAFTDHNQIWICRQPEQCCVPPKGSSAADMLTALSLVIESGKFRNVGGFPTLVSTQNGDFTYGAYHRLSSSWSRSPRKPFGGRDGHGTSASGNFSQSFLPGYLKNDNNIAVRSVPTVYIPQGKIGVVFLPDDNGLMRSVPYHNVPQKVFNQLIFEKYGVVSIMDL